MPTGQYARPGGHRRHSNATATTWSIILRTIEPNQAPTAAFSQTCDGAGLRLRRHGLERPRRLRRLVRVGLRRRRHGDRRHAEHDFLTTGTRDVTLTVTDDEGTTGSVVVPVSVVRTNATPTASFTASCTFLECSLRRRRASDDSGRRRHVVRVGLRRRRDRDNDRSRRRATPTTRAGLRRHPHGDRQRRRQRHQHAQRVAGRDPARSRWWAAASTRATSRLPTPSSRRARRPVTGCSSCSASTTPRARSRDDDRSDRVDPGRHGDLRDHEDPRLHQERSRWATAARRCGFTMDAAAKYTLTIASYTGDMLAPQFAKASETVLRAGHTTPTVDVAAGDWAVSYWADKSSATTAFTLPDDVTQRQTTCGTSTGRICSVLADSDGAVSAGTYGGLTATSNSASAQRDDVDGRAAPGDLRWAPPSRRICNPRHRVGASDVVTRRLESLEACRRADSRPAPRVPRREARPVARQRRARVLTRRGVRSGTRLANVRLALRRH